MGTTLRSGQRAPNNDRRNESYRQRAAQQRQRTGSNSRSPASTPGAVLDQTTGRSYETTSSEIGKTYSSNSDAASSRFTPIASTNQPAALGASYGLQEQQTFSSRPIQGPSAEGGYSSKGSSNRERSSGRAQAAGPLFVNEQGRQNLERAGAAIQGFGDKVSSAASQQEIRQNRVVGRALGRTIYEGGALIEKVGARPRATTLELAAGGLAGPAAGSTLSRGISYLQPAARPVARAAVNIAGTTAFGAALYTAPKGEIGRSAPFVTSFSGGFSRTFTPTSVLEKSPDDNVFSLGGARKKPFTKAELRKRSFNQAYNPNVSRGANYVQERTPRSFRSVEIIEGGFRLTEGRTQKTGAGTNFAALRTSVDNSGRRFNQEFAAEMLPKGQANVLGNKGYARPGSQIKTSNKLDNNALIVLQQQGFKNSDFVGQKRLPARQNKPIFTNPSNVATQQLLESQTVSATRFVPRTGGQRVVTKREERLAVLKQQLKEKQRLRFEQEALQKQLVPRQPTRTVQQQDSVLKPLAKKTEFLPAMKTGSRTLAETNTRFGSLTKTSAKYGSLSAARYRGSQLPRSKQLLGTAPKSVTRTDIDRAIDFPRDPGYKAFEKPPIPPYTPPRTIARSPTGTGSNPPRTPIRPPFFPDFTPRNPEIPFPPLPPPLIVGGLGKSGSPGRGGKQKFSFRRSLTGIELGLKPKKRGATGYSGLEVR